MLASRKLAGRVDRAARVVLVAPSTDGIGDSPGQSDGSRILWQLAHTVLVRCNSVR
ncbi:MAG: hypothetical protein R3F31_20140 [Verrucomicrobiales bacterium]